MYAGEYKTLKTRAVCEPLRFHCASIYAQYFTSKFFQSLRYPQPIVDAEHQIITVKTGQKSRKTRGTNRDARPRKKVSMSEEGATGEQTSVVGEFATREGMVYVKHRVPVVKVGGQRYRMPNELWAWMPSRITYRRCDECSFHDDCRHSQPTRWIKVRDIMRDV